MIPDSLNGFGTTFYGKRDFYPDGSYITTEWMIVLFVPVFPMRSLRVIEKGSTSIPFGQSTHYEVLNKMRPNFKQVLYTYGFVVLCIFWLVAATDFFEPLQTMLGSTLATIASLVALALLACVPYVLRALGRDTTV